MRLPAMVWEFGSNGGKKPRFEIVPGNYVSKGIEMVGLMMSIRQKLSSMKPVSTNEKRHRSRMQVVMEEIPYPVCLFEDRLHPPTGSPNDGWPHCS